MEIEPDSHNGLEAISYARCEDIRAVSVQRLIHRFGEVETVTLTNLASVIRTFLEV